MKHGQDLFSVSKARVRNDSRLLNKCDRYISSYESLQRECDKCLKDTKKEIADVRGTSKRQSFMKKAAFRKAIEVAKTKPWYS